MMMVTPKTTGRATWCAAARTFSRVGTPGSPRRWWRTRRMFSTMTTAPSTMRPKSIAPRLIRLPDTPVQRIAENATSIDSGIAAATSSPARRLPISKSRITTTSRPPSSRLVATVRRVRRTRSERS